MAPGSGTPLRRFQRLLSANELAVDTVIALVLTALTVLPALAGAPGVGVRDAAVALLLLQALPLALRRRFPLAVFVVVLGATVAQLVLAEPGPVRSGLGVLVAVFSVAERLDRRRSLALTAGAAALLGLVLYLRAGLPAGLQGFIQTGAVMVGAWIVGDWARTRRLYLRAIEAEARAVEREREERALRGIVEERERIARELHDVVTHHVSVIVIQAGAGLAAVEAGGDGVRRTLEAIDATGRQALTDMRRMFGIIGEDDGRAPMPGLGQLGDLLEQVRTAGLAVRLSIEGRQRPLDAGLELSAYRIIQEALTNTLKHAQGAHARVSVRYEPDALLLVVEDAGGQVAPAIEPDHVGRGLVGMRQRAEMVAGSLEAHRTATGFRVSARLPLAEPAPAA